MSQWSAALTSLVPYWQLLRVVLRHINVLPRRPAHRAYSPTESRTECLGCKDSMAALDTDVRPSADGEHQIPDPGWSIQGLLREMAFRDTHPAVMTVRRESIQTLTYAEIAEQAHQLASGLIAEDVRAE